MVVTSENRDAHCKFYTKPSIKKNIQQFANINGMTFSEACDSLIKFGMDAVVEKDLKMKVK